MSNITVTGDEPLTDGMQIAVRTRRDLTITSAERFLAAARRAYTELHPAATQQDAAEMVTSAADAVFTILERAGLLGDAADTMLAAHLQDGLQLGGSRAQVTINDPLPLPAAPDCLNDRDVFALPSDTRHR